MPWGIRRIRARFFLGCMGGVRVGGDHVERVVDQAVWIASASAWLRKAAPF